jgi:hypothetical protein
MITGLSFSQLGGIVKMLVTFLIVYQVLSQGFGRIGEAILVRVMSSEAHGITGSQGKGGAPYTLFSQGGR